MRLLAVGHTWEGPWKVRTTDGHPATSDRDRTAVLAAIIGRGPVHRPRPPAVLSALLWHVPARFSWYSGLARSPDRAGGHTPLELTWIAV